MKITVFGLGYVGAVTAACLAARGHQVWGVDVDPAKVDMMNAKISPVVEPGIDELLTQAVDSGALRATTDVLEAMAGSDVSLLCVGTPSTARGDADLTYLRRALEDIRGAMAKTPPPASGQHVVVVRSTVPPGTGDEVVVPALAGELPTGWKVGSAMIPEFLREGSSVEDFFNPPFVVLGAREEWVWEQLSQMFSFLSAPEHRIDVRSAEALKYACNAFHATKVSFTNEMARIFRPLGVDSRKVMEIFAQDTVLNVSPAYLRPAFAYGGSCLPKDIRSLMHMARVNALDVPLLAGTALTNDLVISDVVDRVLTAQPKAVAMLGLSFKMHTDDLRESPNVELAERLLGKGVDVRIYDPIVNPERLIGANLRYIEAKLPHLRKLLAGTAAAALDGVDLAIISTSDAEAVSALLSAKPQRVIDLHGRLGAAVESLPGYDGVGWSVTHTGESAVPATSSQ